MKIVIDPLLQRIAKNRPLVHCITNMITCQFQANGLLAIGASPIMTDEPKGAPQVTQQAQAFLVNIGSPLTKKKKLAIRRSLSLAQERGIPTVLDPVGIASIPNSYHYVESLLEQHRFTLIRGNYAEIARLGHLNVQAKGVDSENSLDNISQIVTGVARQLGSLIIASGATDYISDGTATYAHNYGHPNMRLITGTGCVYTAVTAAFLSQSNSQEDRLEAALMASAYYSWCGELACNKAVGPGDTPSLFLNQLYLNAHVSLPVIHDPVELEVTPIELK